MAGPANPHHLLDHLAADEVGELDVRFELTQVCRLPPDYTIEQIREHLIETAHPPGKYTVYGLHFSSKKQMKGLKHIQVYPPGVPMDGTPSGMTAALMDQQFRLLRDSMDEVKKTRVALEDRARELDRQREEFSDKQHEAELNLERQRHEQGLSFQDRLFKIESERESRYADRQRELDEQRGELELERQKLTSRVYADRLSAMQEAHEMQFEAMAKSHKRRLADLEEQAQQIGTRADPLALLKLLPDKLLGRVIEAQLPKDNDATDDLSAFVKQIEPISLLLAGLRPGAQQQPTREADSHEPETPDTPAPKTISG